MDAIANRMLTILDVCNSFWVMIFATVMIVFLLLWRFSSSGKRDEREPSVVKTWIPYIGHVSNLFYFGQHYLEDLWYRLISFNRYLSTFVFLFYYHILCPHGYRSIRCISFKCLASQKSQSSTRFVISIAGMTIIVATDIGDWYHI